MPVERTLPSPEAQELVGLAHDLAVSELKPIASQYEAEGRFPHTMSCYPLARFGRDEQREEWLPAMLAGDLLGAYALSEPQAGSDAAALSARAVPDGENYRLSGTKAWVTHAGQADFYTVMVRTSDDGGRGVSCPLIDAGTPGLAFGARPTWRRRGAVTGACRSTARRRLRNW